MLEISAGAIVYTHIDNELHYLVIKDFHNNYGFPKGHLEQGETVSEAAKREIKEETGIDIKLNPYFIEELRYPLPNGNDKLSIYFLGYYIDQKPHEQLEEVQEILLLRYEEALDILTFDSMKQILIKANNYINKTK